MSCKAALWVLMACACVPEPVAPRTPGPSGSALPEPTPSPAVVPDPGPPAATSADPLVPEPETGVLVVDASGERLQVDGADVGPLHATPSTTPRRVEPLFDALQRKPAGELRHVRLVVAANVTPLVLFELLWTTRFAGASYVDLVLGGRSAGLRNLRPGAASGLLLHARLDAKLSRLFCLRLAGSAGGSPDQVTASERLPLAEGAYTAFVERCLGARPKGAGKLVVELGPASSTSAFGELVADAAGVLGKPPSVEVRWVSAKHLASDRPPSSHPGGDLPSRVVQATIQAGYPEMRACYERLLRADPDAEGRVTVRFVIGTDGKVTRAEIAPTTAAGAGGDEPELADQPTRACVLDSFRRLTFPPPSGGALTVVYPLSFSPG